MKELTNTAVCVVHDAPEQYTYCMGWAGWCTAWDGEVDENDNPTCRFDYDDEEELNDPGLD